MAEATGAAAGGVCVSFYSSTIRELRECEPLVRILGDPFISAYTIVKEAEYEVFLQVISSWEREHLLLNV